MEGFWKELPPGFAALAPLDGVSDAPFRRAVARLGRPDVHYTEFIQAESLAALPHADESLEPRLARDGSGVPTVVQLWGRDPESFRRAAALVADRGFAGIDINLACPARKLLAKGVCGALIGQTGLAGELIQACREGAGGLPVSVKTRLGADPERSAAWFDWLLGLGLPALAVHGRTVAQGFGGRADWTAIAALAARRTERASATRIIGNGDIATPAELRRRLAESGADGAMVGRAAVADPAFFAPGETHLPLVAHPRRRRLGLLAEHIGDQRRLPPPAGSFDRLKKYVDAYLGPSADDRDLRRALMACRRHDEALALIAAAIDDGPDPDAAAAFAAAAAAAGATRTDGVSNREARP